MNDDLREDRKAQIAELQLALKVAVDALDQLEERIATKQILDMGSLQIDSGENRFANHVAMARKKAKPSAAPSSESPCRSMIQASIGPLPVNTRQ